MECCSDVHSHRGNHFRVDHNHLDHPYASRNSFLEEAVGYLGVHPHNDAFAGVLREVREVVLPYCYTSCVAEAPLGHVEADSFQAVLLGLGVRLQEVVHQDH